MPGQSGLRWDLKYTASEIYRDSQQPNQCYLSLLSKKKRHLPRSSTVRNFTHTFNPSLRKMITDRQRVPQSSGKIELYCLLEPVHMLPGPSLSGWEPNCLEKENACRRCQEKGWPYMCPEFRSGENKERETSAVVRPK